VEAGAGGLELDVHLTRDGHVVVIHDPSVDRTTDGTGAVAGMALAELREVDAGIASAMTRVVRILIAVGPQGTYARRGAGSVSGRRDQHRHKGDTTGEEAAVLEVLRGSGAEGRSLVVSEHHAVVRRVRGLSGGRVATGASRLEIAVFYLASALRLEGLLNPGYEALQVPVYYGGLTLVTRRFVEAAHARGVRVDAWTVNDPAEMHRLLDLGVDVVMTDFPERLAGVLAERGALTPR
jgi:glycerophosphoryl diester phosphodiesterase